MIAIPANRPASEPAKASAFAPLSNAAPTLKLHDPPRSRPSPLLEELRRAIRVGVIQEPPVNRPNSLGPTRWKRVWSAIGLFLIRLFFNPGG